MPIMAGDGSASLPIMRDDPAESLSGSHISETTANSDVCPMVRNDPAPWRPGPAAQAPASAAERGERSLLAMAAGANRRQVETTRRRVLIVMAGAGRNGVKTA